MKPAEEHILRQPEPYQSIMLYVRSVIMKTLDVEEKYSYKLPFYYYNKKSFVFLNVLRGTDYVDVVFMDGALLETEFPELQDANNRKRVRSIQIKRLEDLDEMRFVELLKSASKIKLKTKQK
ncbi:conserved hypothetical protein (DUF1801) [Formosa agariphila KMM 3901]|uniref:YdhG-like domain-containing protein n=1 Tax=Formosa agariphila (strain DSM 15362 / KCTC 12365 / LMG 23005 / KMM 3901 / M-2Alg 35-1) TaxID=1347342 RepID=T2KQI1_FORAG|nr:DUF1801 domain-containing protein [Formosa agariphila]CDF80244.1 conserved hypothetical protein (DUF1801) [Formosa agariphila KMM 3901]